MLFTTGDESFLVSSVLTVIGVLGSLALLGHVLDFAGLLWSCVRPSKVKNYGKWAVVTGATDGIGLAYCQEFARQGLNIVLISRTQSKLDACAEEIQSKFPNSEVKTIQADFNSEDKEVYAKIQDELDRIPVGILVNNVGMSYAYAEYLQFLEEDTVDSLVRMNIVSTNRMTRMVLPGMVDRKKGCIVNISSAAGAMHCGDPMYTIYSASKAYVDFFSRSLDVEYKSKGIDVQCVIPYLVTSKLSKIRHSSLMVPNPRTFAKEAVRNIGYGNSVVPYTWHVVQHYLIQNVLPKSMFTSYLMKMHQGIRKKALKKLEKAK